MTQIAVIGTGAIGRSLGGQWSDAGESVIFGSRNPSSSGYITVGTNKTKAELLSIARAAEKADIVVLAVPHSSLVEVANLIQSSVRGKIVVDCTNAVVFTPEGHIASGLESVETEGTYAARLFPDSQIVRAFTHIQDELLESRGRRQPGVWAVAIAGDDSGAKNTISDLARAIGFVPVDLGSLAESGALDPGGALFPNMFTPADMARVAGLSHF